jgi:hypothetical protein
MLCCSDRLPPGKNVPRQKQKQNYDKMPPLQETGEFECQDSQFSNCVTSPQRDGWQREEGSDVFLSAL